MWHIFLLLLPLVTADYFKETQDFQYSRTGDDGVKKGYYNAQTGNMGGNFEVAHNMDHLATDQLTNLRHQVGSQLGIDPSVIGTGDAVNSMNSRSGSIYGSASASGKAFHKGTSEYDMGGLQNSRIGSFSASQRGIASGSKSSSQFSNYDSFNTDQESLGQQSNKFGESSRTASHYMAGSKYAGSARNDYESERDRGEIYSSAAARNQQRQYGQVYGVGERNQEMYGAANSGHHSSHSAYEKSESQNAGTVVQTLPIGTHVVPLSSVVQPVSLPSNVRVILRPGQTVHLPISVPVQTVENSNLQAGYVQGSSFGTSESQRRESSHHSNSQVGTSATAAQGAHLSSVNHLAGGNNLERNRGTKGYESSYSYKKEWESHGSSPSLPTIRPVVYTVDNNEDLRSIAHTDNAESSRTHDSSRITYGTNYHAGRQNVAQYGSSKNKYVNWDEKVENQNLRSNTRNVEGNQQSSNYQKEWEIHGRPAVLNQQKGESSTYNYDKDLGRSNDRLYVVHGSGMNRGSEISSEHLASNQRQNFAKSQTYAAQAENHEQRYDESNSQSQRNLENAQIYGANRGDLSNFDNSHVETSKPKSYQSSYSYHKSWEKHGTPYVIYPATGNLQTDNLNTGSSHASDSQSQSSSWSAAAGKQSSSHSSSNSNYASGHSASNYGTGEALTTNMDRLQQELRNKMSEMCQNCDDTKSKGYSASYSYSAQRSYGGAQDMHRRKRKVDRSELSELDEYDNISIQNKIAEYNTWREQVQDLRQRVKNIKKQITVDGEKDLNEIKNSRKKGETQKSVESVERENTETEEEIKDLDDLRVKIESLRRKIQRLSHKKIDDDQLKNDVEMLKKKVGDFNTRLNTKQRIPRDVDVEFLGQQTEDLGQQTQDMWQYADLGQQTEDLGQQTEDLHSGSLHLGQQTEDLGQQTEDLHLGSLHLGQQTEDLGQQTQDSHSGYHLGQQTDDFGQQTQDSHSGFYLGQQTQNSNQQSQNSRSDSFSHTRESQTNLNIHQQQSQSSYTQNKTQSHVSHSPINHSDKAERDKIELDHIQELLRNMNNKPVQPVSANSRREKENQDEETEGKSFLEMHPREEKEQQTLQQWSDVGQQLESSHAQIQDVSGKNVNYGQETEDFGQKFEKVEDWKPNGEVQVVEKANVQQTLVEPYHIVENKKDFELKQDIIQTTTEKAGFWRRVGNKAKSWFGKSS